MSTDEWLRQTEERRRAKRDGAAGLRTELAQQLREMIAQREEHKKRTGSVQERLAMANRVEGLRDALQAVVGTRE